MKRFLGLLCVTLCLISSARADGVSQLVKQLKDTDAEMRRSAAKSLGEMGADAKEAVPDLMKSLKDGDMFVRRFSAQALAGIGPDAKDAIPALKDALGDKRKEVAEAAAGALAKLGPNGVSTLSDLAKDKKKDTVLRQKAVEALGHAGEDAKPAVSVLGDLLADSNIAVDAAAALGELGPVAKDDKILDTLRDLADKKTKDRSLRETAQSALRKIMGQPDKKK
jgi:HEAT repeat protein